MDYDVGVDIGTVSINCIILDENQRIVLETPYLRHFGLVYKETHSLLDEIIQKFGAKTIRSVSFTGVHGELLAQKLGAPFEVETIAQVQGAIHVQPGVRSIISMGGQDAAIFQLAHSDGQWRLESFNMNGPCASGTGSFIDQQAERLAQSIYGADFSMNREKLQQTLEDFVQLGLKSTFPAPVACRCTVFTKSDMIHLQNKGESLANIIAGLHFGNAANYVSSLIGNRELLDPIVFIGGMASNRLQVKAFEHYFPSMTVPACHTSVGALGMAILAGEKKWRNAVDLSILLCADSQSAKSFPRAKRLKLSLSRFDSDTGPAPWAWKKGKAVEAYLGIDIGSTSTKYALISDKGQILHKCYVPTRGKPIEVTQKLLRTLQEEAGGGKVKLMAIATTGSGRNVVGDFLSSDLVIDEITAHARGAVQIDPEVDTIFEIGGQDSKYIMIDNTHPFDFAMNKVCAAGTGSFLHELANKMNINIVGEFQDIALGSKSPIHLAERCTVFMESDLASYMQKGGERQDLIAGLCYAIVYNYLNRVVEKRRIGKRVMFLGGPSLNKGIVAAFERVLGREVLVPQNREVMGAFGAALSVMELFKKEGMQYHRRDLDQLASMDVNFTESICSADKKCHNECKLKIYNFGERKSVWGGDCGRYETRVEGVREVDYFQVRQAEFEKALSEAGNLLTEAEANRQQKPVIGIPLALHSLEWGVLWAHLFSELGFPVLMSPRTTNKLAFLGVENVISEVCFPVKVFHGHVRYLMDRAEYLFLPNVVNAPVPHQEEVGYFCPLVQSSQFMSRSALNISDGRIIRPSLYLKEGPQNLVFALEKAFPRALRPKRGELAKAISIALARQEQFRNRLLEAGKEILHAIDPAEPVWIVTGRPYNLYDERLNLQLGKQLAKLGIKAVPMDMIDSDSEDMTDFKRMFWGLGARIIRTAKMIARTPNWYGVHLTNFSCGADSFIEHFYRHLLADKPSLILELDEHSAVAGLLTRVEAYRNVVRNIQEKRLSAKPHPIEGDPFEEAG
ncbi:MAG: acyl-CoA dehydratase activase [Syntrophobacteraceae bacterium]|nr:acyl-CoA dehydratase activase [Syntrophobacteraceae bacterium]